jgi:hypothetical protein
MARVESDPSVLLPGMAPPHIRLTEATRARLMRAGGERAMAKA